MTLEHPPDCPHAPESFWRAVALTAVACALPTLVEQLGKLARAALKHRRETRPKE